MKISQTQRQIIIRGIQKDKSVPKIAGDLSNHTANDKELSDLVSMINKTKKEYEQRETSRKENSNQNDGGSSSGDSSTEELSKQQETENDSLGDSEEIDKEAYEVDDELRSEPPVIDVIDEDK